MPTRSTADHTALHVYVAHSEVSRGLDVLLERPAAKLSQDSLASAAASRIVALSAERDDVLVLGADEANELGFNGPRVIGPAELPELVGNFAVRGDEPLWDRGPVVYDYPEVDERQLVA